MKTNSIYRIYLTILACLALLAIAPGVQAQGDQPLPTPPAPGTPPPPAPPGPGDKPPTAPSQGEGDTVVPPPPPASAPKKVVAVKKGPPADMPVVRADGNWGFIWRLGGLATLSHTGNTRQVNAGAAMTHIGLKYAPSETWMFPIYAGVVLNLQDPPGDDNSATNFGVELGGGVEYHFRIWRRISPFVGATVGLFYTNPTGDDSYDIGVGIGPTAGIEYYIADRLSVQALYTFVIAMAFETRPSATGDKGTRTSFGAFTSIGGALNVTYYF